MAETIKRYDREDCDMVESEVGVFVWYDDHAAAIAAKEEEIERLRSAVVFAYHALDTIFIDAADGSLIESAAGEGLDMLRPIVEAMPHPVKPMRPEGSQ